MSMFLPAGSLRRDDEDGWPGSRSTVWCRRSDATHSSLLAASPELSSAFSVCSSRHDPVQETCLVTMPARRHAPPADMDRLKTAARQRKPPSVLPPTWPSPPLTRCAMSAFRDAGGLRHRTGMSHRPISTLRRRDFASLQCRQEKSAQSSTASKTEDRQSCKDATWPSFQDHSSATGRSLLLDLLSRSLYHWKLGHHVHSLLLPTIWQAKRKTRKGTGND